MAKSGAFKQRDRGFTPPETRLWLARANPIVMGIILLILIIILLFGSLPRWKHSKDWGYAPTGGLGLLLLILLILVLMGVIPRGF